jgi:Tfp pilus assembly protein PilF
MNENDNIKIDDRIYKVCQNAENEYSHNQRNNLRNNPLIENGLSTIKDNQMTFNKLYSNYNSIDLNNEVIEKMSGNNYASSEKFSGNNHDLNEKRSENLNESYSKIAKINNKSIDSDINVLSKIKFGVKNEKEQNINNNYTNIKSPFHKSSDNYSKKIALYNLDSNNNKTNNKQNSKKELSQHKTHNKNSNLSKILLESRDLIKKKKLKQAYILLKQTISTGIQHSDLFYLYGEINRILRQNNTAENYLIKSLKFELHSPYAFFSLGLLYQDMKQYQNSNKFFSLFNRLLDNADVHFQKAINYFNMKDFVNSAEEISKAIDLNNDCGEYYLFRSEIYKNMGLKEMEDEDYYMYNYINRKKLEDEL